MTTPTYNLKEVKKILKDNGWYLERQTGGHEIYKNKEGKHISIGLCRNNKQVFQRLIRENNLITDKKILKKMKNSKRKEDNYDDNKRNACCM